MLSLRWFFKEQIKEEELKEKMIDQFYENLSSPSATKYKRIKPSVINL